MQMAAAASTGMAPPEWATGGDGIHALDEHKTVRLEQVMDMVQTITMMDMPNKYQVLTDDGKMLFLMEEVPTYSPNAQRAFNVEAKDAGGNVLFSVERDFRMCSYCCFCFACCDACKSEAKIKIGGEKAAKLEQKVSFNSAKFELEIDGKDMYEINGSTQCCTAAVEYELDRKKGKDGSIKRLTTGMAGHMGINKYAIKFPKEADANEKAILICCNVLLDFRFHYYVAPMQQRRGGRRH